MRVLLLYPATPPTFWSFKHALKFVRRRAAFAPLGLLTVAAMLPASWELRLVDCNVRPLGAADLDWADMAMISAMTVQRDQARQLVDRCRRAGLRVVAGGPLFTIEHDGFPEVDHLVLDEAELSLPPFLADLERGDARRVYRAEGHADLRQTPVPRWDLVKVSDYATLSLQFSRGCPFSCDFCNVTMLLGRRTRTKTTAQVLAELDAIHALGWRDAIFFVDDNFIGDRKRVKRDLLPALAAWRTDKRGVSFLTEASIDLSDDDDLMEAMVAAGFESVFVGLETPDERSLVECGKSQNENRDLAACVRRIHRAGLQVQAGFIVGFDNDSASIFDRLLAFIQEAGIVTAMVGVLQALPGTKLFDRLNRDGRIVGMSSGDNVDGTTNIETRMERNQLMQGYRRVLARLYSPGNFYGRVRRLLADLPSPAQLRRTTMRDIHAAVRSTLQLGIIGRERLHYWGLLLWTLLRCRHHLPLAIGLSIYGYHFRRVACQHVGR